jgi:pterin-4a-carbinolamine dehydratase
VTVSLTTHAAGGITLADVGLAARVDAVPVECSPKWLKEQGK